jgi:pimeloyl-ACP methyl ester carboxylesterase
MEAKTPVMFIHGLWLHASSWEAWMSYFEQAGYTTMAPGWPGEPESVDAARKEPENVANYGIAEVAAYFAEQIDRYGVKPIVIGHSFGGMLAQKLLGENYAAAAIAIDAAQIKGVLPLPLSTLRSTLPVFKNPANKHKAVTLTFDEFRYAFANALPEEEASELYDRWVVPAPGRPLFEAAAANFSVHSPAKVNTRNDSRGPLLLITGGSDHTVPEAITKATLRQYRHSEAVTQLLGFPGRGHSLTIDAGWHDVADASLSWLVAQGL